MGSSKEGSGGDAKMSFGRQNGRVVLIIRKQWGCYLETFDTLSDFSRESL
jgi:hypothetical protein